MTTFIAALAGIATVIGVNFLIAIVRALACGASQFLNMLLRFSYFALPIKMVGWFASFWAGLSVFEAMGGM